MPLLISLHPREGQIMFVLPRGGQIGIVLPCPPLEIPRIVHNVYNENKNRCQFLLFSPEDSVLLFGGQTRNLKDKEKEEIFPMEDILLIYRIFDTYAKNCSLLKIKL